MRNSRPGTPAAGHQDGGVAQRPARAVTHELSHHRRLLVAGPVVSVIAILSALLATGAVGLPLRDPDHVAGRRLLIVFGLVAVLVALDIFFRARSHPRWTWSSRAALAAVRRERWTRARGVAVASALISFYLTYLAYRNLKSVVPLVRPDELFDRQLADLDRSLFGVDPAAFLHTVLGTGIQTHALAVAYMMFFAFIPGTLAAALVFSRNLQGGLFYVTAQSINWLLAAACYFLLPALGPVYFEPAVFAHLPSSGITDLQNLLLDQRTAFLSDPIGGNAQSIGAFSSLHVSVFFTGVLAAHLLGIARPLRIGAWVLFGATVASTVYLGWHYVVDDLAGLVTGALAILLARGLTGVDLSALRGASAPKAAVA